MKINVTPAVQTFETIMYYLPDEICSNVFYFVWHLFWPYLFLFIK